MKKQQISIIGCGWLGFTLAKHLIKMGYNINGSTTSAAKLSNLKSSGIHPFLIALNEDKLSGDINTFLNDSETLIINIPPGLRRNPEKNHVAEIKLLVEAVETSSIKNVLYISSTSVFENKFPITTITENTMPNATSNSGKQLMAIEKLIQNNKNFNGTILRFAGLIDANRHPGQMLSGRKNIANGEAPINLIHKNDCIAIITKLIANNIWNTTLNACYPLHTAKKQYYTTYCKTHNLELPEFDSNPSKGKIITSQKLAQLLNYDYQTSV